MEILNLSQFIQCQAPQCSEIVEEYEVEVEVRPGHNEGCETELSPDLKVVLRPYGRYIQNLSMALEVDPALIVAPIFTENSLNVSLLDDFQDFLFNATGWAFGSIGIGQIYESTAREYLPIVNYFLNSLDDSFQRSLILEYLPESVSSRFVTSSSSHSQPTNPSLTNPAVTLLYSAVIAKTAIATYEKCACIDIEDDIGVLSTLYNVGDIISRAERAFERFSGEDRSLGLNSFGAYARCKEEQIREFLHEIIPEEGDIPLSMVTSLIERGRFYDAILAMTVNRGMSESLNESEITRYYWRGITNHQNLNENPLVPRALIDSLVELGVLVGDPRFVEEEVLPFVTYQAFYRHNFYGLAALFDSYPNPSINIVEGELFNLLEQVETEQFPGDITLHGANKFLLSGISFIMGSSISHDVKVIYCRSLFEKMRPYLFNEPSDFTPSFINQFIEKAPRETLREFRLQMLRSPRIDDRILNRLLLDLPSETAFSSEEGGDFLLEIVEHPALVSWSLGRAVIVFGEVHETLTSKVVENIFLKIIKHPKLESWILGQVVTVLGEVHETLTSKVVENIFLEIIKHPALNSWILGRVVTVLGEVHETLTSKEVGNLFT